MMRATADSDVHLEADIRATADNRQGFQEGSFVPYLNVSFQLKKQGNDTQLKGDFHAMVANDGPHYGDNVKLLGPGKHPFTFTVLPPGGHASLGRRTDKETGMAPWFDFTPPLLEVPAGQRFKIVLRISAKARRSSRARHRESRKCSPPALLKTIAGGYSNKVIGHKLGITEGTVKVHVKNLLHKLGLRSRVEAAVWAMEHLRGA
ncbi:iron transporter [Pseudomonas sp. Z5-35]